MDEELKEQIAITEKSQFFIRFIVAAVLLSYTAVEIQKRELLGEDDCLPEPFPFRLVANAMVVIALIFFYGLSEQGLCQTPANRTAGCSAKYNFIASVFVLLAALIRLYDVIFVNFCTPPAETE